MTTDSQTDGLSVGGVVNIRSEQSGEGLEALFRDQCDAFIEGVRSKGDVGASALEAISRTCENLFSTRAGWRAIPGLRHLVVTLKELERESEFNSAIHDLLNRAEEQSHTPSPTFISMWENTRSEEATVADGSPLVGAHERTAHESNGRHPSACGLENQGFRNLKAVHWNLTAPALYEAATLRGEGHVAKNGPFVVLTGQHTGRSASDKFIVKDANSESQVWWDNNKAMTPDHFDALFQSMMSYAQGRELFVQDLFGGADPAHRLAVRVVTEYAWHSLFIQHLLIEPTAGEQEDFVPDYTIIDLPGFHADPVIHGCARSTVIAVNFTKKIILIGGTSYAGEMKKSVFTILNYLLPARRVMPMQCSANVGPSRDVAIFFGLSGTGKTTLSTDPSRMLLGDAEHGWSESGIFNFEGGCYAKIIHLSADAEPQIYETTRRFGTILENVVLDPITRELDLDDDRYTENTRAAYPINFIPNASMTGIASHPKNIFMLAADAFGVLPPISKLTPSQAMYHFLSGYTAKVASIGQGLGKEPQPTFSTCFGAPFMPRHPTEYGNLLRDLIAQHGSDCWLVNTGWTGGAYGVGHRISIKVVRALLGAALNGTLANAAMRVDPHFRFRVPTQAPGVDTDVLNPRDTWADKRAYDIQARRLVAMFRENFKSFELHVGSDVLEAARQLEAVA